MALKI